MNGTKGWIFLGMALMMGTLAESTRPPLELVAQIPLPGVQGRIDHMAYNPKTQQIFVAALGNDTLEVVNLNTHKVQSRKGFSEPQGAVWIAPLNQLFVTNGGDGSGDFLKGDSLEMVQRIAIGEDADNVRLDAQGKKLYVGYGSALAVLDWEGRKLADIPLAAHPESFQLETRPNGEVSRIFVNLPGVGQIGVVDPEQGRVVQSWRISARANFPMALDTLHQRLLIATRDPPRLIILDTKTGKEVANLPAVADADDVYYDTQRKRVYVSGGGGVVLVYQQASDKYSGSSQITTAPGARTSFWDGEHQLFVAAPRQGNLEARLLVFEARN